VQVETVVAEEAIFAEELFNQSGKQFLSAGHDFEDQKTDIDSVPLRQERFDAYAARFFTSDEDVAGGHELADILEADRKQMHFQVVFLANPVDHIGQCECFCHFTPLFFFFDQVFQDNGKQFVRVDKVAFLVKHADPVGVTVVDDADIGLDFIEKIDKVRNVLRYRFRIYAVETWIDVAVVAIDHRFVKQAGNDVLTCAIHGIVGDFKPGFPDETQVKVFFEVVDVACLDVGHNDQVSCRSDRIVRVYGQKIFFNLFDDFGVSWSSV